MGTRVEYDDEVEEAAPGYHSVTRVRSGADAARVAARLSEQHENETRERQPGEDDE